MKILCLLSIILGLATATLPLPGTVDQNSKMFYHELEEKLKLQQYGDGEITATLNNYADKVFANLDKLIVKQGVDPLNLPDINERISQTILFITYYGDLNLTQGILHNTSSISRYGDVIATYSPGTSKLVLTVPITFNILAFNYNYNVDIMSIGLHGGVTGSVSDFHCLTTIVVDFNTYLISVADYEVLSSGHFSIHFDGNVLIDWLINLITNVATTALKLLIENVIETIVKGTLEAVVSAINNLVQGILNPPIPPLLLKEAYHYIQPMIIQ